MLETECLILGKAKFSDWEAMYHNVWSRPESARYMSWKLTASERDAQIRMRKTIHFQKLHDTYLVYEKSSNMAIGFAGVEQAAPRVCQETGICLGPDYVRRGFGKQILGALMQYAREEYLAEEFRYASRQENRASNRLAEAMGFRLFTSEHRTDWRDGCSYQMLWYRIRL